VRRLAVASRAPLAASHSLSSLLDALSACPRLAIPQFCPAATCACARSPPHPHHPPLSNSSLNRPIFPGLRHRNADVQPQMSHVPPASRESPHDIHLARCDSWCECGAGGAGGHAAHLPVMCLLRSISKQAVDYHANQRNNDRHNISFPCWQMPCAMSVARANVASDAKVTVNKQRHASSATRAYPAKFIHRDAARRLYCA
jgi:hypothetical protein